MPWATSLAVIGLLAGVLSVALFLLLRSTVGPLGDDRPPTSVTLPVEKMFTELSHRDAVLSALHDELAGGPATGFSPTVHGDQVLVSFTSVLVHAERSID